MKAAYEKRPTDFKRKILKRNIPSEILLDEEYRWLNLIKKDELGKKYYNIRNTRSNLWYQIEDKKTTVAEKISRSNRGKKRTEEQKKRMSDAQKGRVLSREHREKIADSLRGRKQPSSVIEKRSKSMIGHVVTDQTRAKLRITSSRQVMSAESRRKISESKRGKPHPISEETRKKISTALKGKPKRKRTCSESHITTE